jgi:superfamily II DNA or RNA helicase
MSTSTTLHLRDYQTETIEAVRKAWRSGMQRPAVVLPTGAGKTVVFAHLASQWIANLDGPLDVLKMSPGAGRRVVVLVHRDELADQAIAKIRTVAPHLNVGKVKAADNDVDADVMVCSVQTLARPSRLTKLLDAQKVHGEVGLVIVDECHHAAATSYRTVMGELGCYDPSSATRAVGVTATLARGDGQGLGDVWEDVVYSRSVLWMISRGYLVDVKGQVIESSMDLGSVKKTGGDYQAKDLGEELLAAGGPDLIAKAMHQYAPQRRSVVFTPDVASAVATAEALNAAGIRSGMVSGSTPRDERLETYRKFRTGVYQALVNCMVLTEGFDAPWADCAVIARPTQSAPLYIQMVGRVLRTWGQDKRDALVLDITGTGGRISTLIDLAPGEVRSMRDGESLAEAYVRSEEEANQRIPARSLAFSLKNREMDMFAGSDHAWLRTEAGVLFLSGGVTDRKTEVLLWPSADPGRWDVVVAPDKAPWTRAHTGLELGMAQAWGETTAEDLAEFNATRTASWRKAKPSPQQLDFARRMRIPFGDDIRKGPLSDLISIKLVSKKVDKFIPKEER